jgi:predicted Zn-dependent peptidase
MSPVDRSRLPVPGPEPAFAFPSADKRRLDNGLRLWTLRRDQLPLVSVVLMLPSGAAFDPDGMPGLAALTADMLDEGSGDRSAIEMQEALARIGADLDTEAGPDAVVLSMTLLDRFLDDGLRLLADMVCRPRLADTDVTRVCELRMNRLRQIKDAPGANAEAVFSRALYGAHPYGHLPIGTSVSLERLVPADVARFHASMYQPARATVILVGAVDTERAARAVSEAFGSWLPATAPDFVEPHEPHPPGATQRAASTRVLLVDRPGAAQTELRIGHVAVPRRTADFHALVLMNAVLGGHFMSRINLNLREHRGFTYGARSAYDFRRQAGPFSVQTSVQTGATGEAIREVLAEMQAIRGERPASDDEMALSKSTLTKGYPRSFETTGQVARGLAQLALYELPDDTFASFSPRVRALDREAVTDVAVRHLDPARSVVVAVGDRARIEEDLRRLGLGEPTLTTADL